MTPDGLFGWLESAPCGAFALAMDQTVVFWNASARRILGHTAGRVVGLKCYNLVAGVPDRGLTADCAEGCASMRYARVGMMPAPVDLMMRCASGSRKMVRVEPMVVSAVGDAGPFVVYLFGDAEEQSPPGSRASEVRETAAGASLTPRELEVLRYLAVGWDTASIAEEMGVTHHTVRNHSMSLRRKLDVRSSLEAIMVAVRLGILSLDVEGHSERS